MGIIFPFFIFVSMIEMLVSDKYFYMDQMVKNDVIENTGIYPPDIDYVITEIIAYLNNEREDFDIIARLALPDAKNVTEKNHLFNEKEITHMDDVRHLYQTVLAIRDFSIILMLLCLFYLMKIEPKQIIFSIFGGSIFYIVLFGLIGIFFMLDFQSSFIKFHQLFFSNELWVMDPSKDLLISIVPEPFFIALIRRIIINISVFMIGTLSLTGLFIYQNQKRGKNENT
ncbi:TIGR01906 family membrane protein [Eubacteriaceae bacterium ES3]|nr:TIGR01906 family membrane protein [Eubacteriaceae bacterium ES3]